MPKPNQHPSPGVVRKLYVSCPVAIQHTIQYEKAVSALRERFGELLEAKGLYFSNQDWLEKWPRIVNGTTGVEGESLLHGFAFIVDAEGWIGKGSATELADALIAKLPVYLVTLKGEIREWENVRLIVRRFEDWKRHAQFG